MALYYHCRQCGTEMGIISASGKSYRDLGFGLLSQQDQEEMMNVDQAGHVHVDILCESCDEATALNPDLHEQTVWIH
ncbi:anti-sigma-F factor Fin [Natribacillus halophilus]|uniref:Anti-sigma-F factor Fin n=1 Tax=Natribacillus halophilus TaxID=549003 RepID=A0A1G8RJE8_9BACI|nr:anti-sigma-F factor Fin [Natribacillus halophilus]SDJ17107.1 Protein of unknown function [Natribacillus halophilus]